MCLIVQCCFSGSSSGGSELLPLTQTSSLSHATADDIQLDHGQSLYVTVTCTNSLDLTQSIMSSGELIVSRAPNAEHGYVVFHPQSHTDFMARDGTQANNDLLEFSFQGFEDIVGITVSSSFNISYVINRQCMKITVVN